MLKKPAKIQVGDEVELRDGRVGVVRQVDGESKEYSIRLLDAATGKPVFGVFQRAEIARVLKVK